MSWRSCLEGECVIQRIVDQLRLDSEPRGLIPIDLEGQGGAACLVIGCNVPEFGQSLQFRVNSGAPLIKLPNVGVLQRVLVERSRRTAADIDILRGLQEQGHILDLRKLW